MGDIEENRRYSTAMLDSKIAATGGSDVRDSGSTSKIDRIALYYQYTKFDAFLNDGPHFWFYLLDLLEELTTSVVNLGRAIVWDSCDTRSSTFPSDRRQN